MRRSRLSAWAFVLAAALPGPAGADPVLGAWTAPEDWPAGPTHAHLLPTGKVMFFGEFEDGHAQYVWDPETNAIEQLPYVGFNIFCSGHAYLEDGRLFLAGGHLDSHVGLDDAAIFDPLTLTWQAVPKMNGLRWYPSATTLADGSVLVVSGETNAAGVVNELPQVYEPWRNAWRDLTGAEAALPYYPRQFLAPDGRVFIAGPRQQTYFMDPTGEGALVPFGELEVGGRTYGGAVMYEPGKILVVGGGEPPTAVAEVIDLAEAQPTWRTVAPMSTPRRQHNTIMLPDGNVLVTGGSYGDDFDDDESPVFHAESWNPATGTWTRLASNTIYRGYHSTALLLPDGRVLVGGGRHDRTAGVFSPPYLFRGPRPVITSAPSALARGQAFSVGTPDPSRVAKVSLVRLGSVTHAFDQNTRFVPLSFGAEAGGVRVTAPADPNLAPPGPYMLFLVDGDGVPSIARMVTIPSGDGPVVPTTRLQVTAPNGGETFAPGTTIDVTWQSEGDVGPVDLEYSLDLGRTWISIARSTSNSGSHRWRVPSVRSERALVRVARTADRALADQTDEPFRVTSITRAPPVPAAPVRPKPEELDPFGVRPRLQLGPTRGP